MEQAEPGIMRRAPRPLKEQLFAGDALRLMLTSSAVCGLTLLVFFWALHTFDGLAEIRAVTFTFSILIEILLAFYSRSRFPIWRIGFFTNKWLIAAALVPLLLHIPLLYTPLRDVFAIAPLTLQQGTLVLCTALAGFLFLELTKSMGSVAHSVSHGSASSP
jgi:magnesium-transporting ATPase (P-type)